LIEPDAMHVKLHKIAVIPSNNLGLN